MSKKKVAAEVLTILGVKARKGTKKAAALQAKADKLKKQKETASKIDKRVKDAITKGGGDTKKYTRKISNENLKSAALAKKKKEEATKKVKGKNIETQKKGESQTQKSLRFKKKYDVQEGMGLDAESGGSRRAAQDVDQGKAGTVTQAKGQNFVQSQINKARVSEAKQKVSLQGKVDRGTATAREEAKLNKLKKADKDATGKSRRGQRTKVKVQDGTWFNKQTGEEITDPKFKNKLTEGGKENAFVNWTRNPTEREIEQANKNRIARGMTKREREMAGLKSGELKSLTKLSKTPKGNVAGKGGTGRNRQNLNMGGLTKPTANQTGLKKLPTAVRNKMGYMYGGGMSKKPRMSSMDYRKGGLVIMIGQAKPMKNKKGK